MLRLGVAEAEGGEVREVGSEQQEDACSRGSEFSMSYEPGPRKRLQATWSIFDAALFAQARVASTPRFHLGGS